MKFPVPGWLALAGLFSACSPQVIYTKERDVVENAPPSPSEQVDDFLYQEATGPVDVLIAFDNSINLEDGLSSTGGIGLFDQTYENLVQTLKTSAATHNVDFRVQLVTASWMQSPTAIAQPTQDPSAQFAELFQDTSAKLAILSANPTARESGYPQPFEAIASALGQDGLKQRVFTTTFVVAVLGSEADSNDLSPQAALSFGTALDASRGLYQSHLLVMDRGSATGFPGCADFSAAPQFESAVATIAWSTTGNADLCDSQWQNWQQTLVSRIVAQKTRMVLSHVPYMPDTMMLISKTRTYRYGDDYTFDAVKNEITFNGEPGLQAGDPLSVTYYLTPATSPLPGGTTPLPITSPSPTSDLPPGGT